MNNTNLILSVFVTLAFIQIEVLGENTIPVASDYGVRINSLSGQVEIRHSENSGVWNRANSGTELLPGDCLRSREKSFAVLSLGEISTIAVKDMTQITLISKPGKWYQFTLSDGTMMADVYGPMAEDAMEVDMSQAVVKIKKAKFIIQSSDASSILKVIEGSVSFVSKANGKVVHVADGEFVHADGLGVSTPQRIDLVLDKLELTHYKTIAAQNPVKSNQKKVIPISGTKGSNLVIPLWWYAAPISILLLVLIFILFKKRKKKPAIINQLVPPVVIPSETDHLCRNCGSPLPEGAKFCTKCGEIVQPIQKVLQQEEAMPKCRKCGKVILSGEKFCTNCGTPFEADSVFATSQVKSEFASIKSPLQEKQSDIPGKEGHKFLNITLSVIVIVGLALAGLYYFGTYQPSLTASRAALFEDERYDPININTAATEVETIFAAADTAGLARIMSPTSLELRRQYFPELAPHMPAFARDFKTRKLLYATPRLAVFEFTSPEGKFTVDFCLGEGGKWMLMRF